MSIKQSHDVLRQGKLLCFISCDHYPVKRAERERSPVVAERERSPVVAKRERSPVVAERERSLKPLSGVAGSLRRSTTNMWS